MGHFAARLGAGPAGLRAVVTVIHAVLGALGSADVADLRAEGADLGGELGAARHLASGERADLGAAAVELDAANQSVDVGLAEAGRGATFAGFDAVVAGLDAVVKGEVAHGEVGRRRSRRQAQWADRRITRYIAHAEGLSLGTRGGEGDQL
jgi:hypothetical protein